MKLEIVLRDLYENEINAQVSSFYDGGFTISLGDYINGIKEQKHCWDIGDVSEQLARMAMRHFPDSRFTKRYSLLYKNI